MYEVDVNGSIYTIWSGFMTLHPTWFYSKTDIKLLNFSQAEQIKKIHSSLVWKGVECMFLILCQTQFVIESNDCASSVQM